MVDFYNHEELHLSLDGMTPVETSTILSQPNLLNDKNSLLFNCLTVVGKLFHICAKAFWQIWKSFSTSVKNIKGYDILTNMLKHFLIYGYWNIIILRDRLLFPNWLVSRKPRWRRLGYSGSQCNRHVPIHQ